MWGILLIPIIELIYSFVLKGGSKMKFFSKVSSPALLMFFFSKSYDSKGFTFGINLGTIARFLMIFRLQVQFHYWKNYDNSLGWNLSVQLGRGAGYQWGRTFYLAWKTKGGAGMKYAYNRHPGLRIGFTQNGNSIPYSFRA